jgi:hypothetical protein
VRSWIGEAHKDEAEMGDDNGDGTPGGDPGRANISDERLDDPLCRLISN